MDDIIMLALFTYPGAVAYAVYTCYARGKMFHRESGSGDVGVIFFASVALTMVSMLIYCALCGIRPGIQQLTEHIRAGNAIWGYLLLSLCVSVLGGLAAYAVQALRHGWRRSRAKSHKKAREGIYQQVWQEILHMPEVPTRNIVIEIKKNGQRIRAGIALRMTEDLRTDQGFALMKCRDVEAYLEQYGRFSDNEVSYVDAASGVEIVLHDADRYIRWYAGEDYSEAAAETEAAESQG